MKSLKQKSLLLGFILIAVGLMSDAQAAKDTRDICRKRVAVDYARIFREMQGVQPPPASGILPFAPPGSRLYQTSASQIQLTDGAFGYAFTAKRRQWPIRLDWVVTTRIAKVDRKGNIVDIVSKKQASFGFVGDIRNLDFTMPLPISTGLFRYEVAFRNDVGRKLAKYSQYVRVVNPSLSVILRLNSDVYKPHERVFMQVANIGTIPISYGEGLRVARFDGNYWVPVVKFFPQSGQRRVLRLNAGEAGPCENLEIPAEATPGSYRIEKRIASVLGRSARELTVRFRIEE
jgi:hypothetical protein